VSAKPLTGSELPLLLRVITMATAMRQAAAASAETAATTAEVSEVCMSGVGCCVVGSSVGGWVRRLSFSFS
jgi:hypothetical protein